MIPNAAIRPNKPILPTSFLDKIPVAQIKAIARVAIPIIVASSLTVAMLACSLFLPIPFLAIVAGAGTLSFMHSFGVRFSPQKCKNFLKSECERLRMGKGPSVTAEEMGKMIRSMKFHSILSKVMLAINAIFLVSPLCVMNYRDYRTFDNLIPQMELYQQLLDLPCQLGTTQSLKVKLDLEQIEKQKKAPPYDDLCKDEAKYRAVRQDYFKYIRSLMLLAGKRMIKLNPASREKLEKRDPTCYPALIRLTILEELENSLFLKANECPPSLDERRKLVEDIKGKNYLTIASRPEKERLAQLLMQEKPSISDDDMLKIIHERICKYSDDFLEEQLFVPATSKEEKNYTKYLKNAMQSASKQLVRLDPKVNEKLTKKNEGLYTSAYRLCVLELVKGTLSAPKEVPPALKGFQIGVEEVQKLYAKSNDKSVLKELLMNKEMDDSNSSEDVKKMHQKVADLTLSLIPRKLCTEKTLRNALSKKSVDEWFNHVMFNMGRSMSIAGETLLYNIPN